MMLNNVFKFGQIIFFTFFTLSLTYGQKRNDRVYENLTVVVPLHFIGQIFVYEPQSKIELKPYSSEKITYSNQDQVISAFYSVDNLKQIKEISSDSASAIFYTKLSEQKINNVIDSIKGIHRLDLVYKNNIYSIVAVKQFINGKFQIASFQMTNNLGRWFLVVENDLNDIEESIGRVKTKALLELLSVNPDDPYLSEVKKEVSGPYGKLDFSKLNDHLDNLKNKNLTSDLNKICF